MINFGAWLPDLGDYDNPGVIEAKNVAPSANGYKQVLRLNAATNSVDSQVRGAFAAQSSTQANFNYVGTGSKLYQLVSSTWTDQSKASGTYAVSVGDSWEFAKWGETVIAVGGINSGTPIPPQVITMGASGSTEFADLGGSPPQSRHLAVVRDFVVLGNLYEDTTDYPSRIRWSGINSSTTWGTDPQVQSDYNDLGGEGGWIRGIRGGEYGVIFQERSIWKMEYIGPPVIFAFDETLPGIGTSFPNSIVQYGDDIFFLGQTGFKLVRGGSEIIDIGKNKIDKWFYANLDANFPERVIGALDRRNRRIIWLYPSDEGSDGESSNGLIFDLNTGEWSYFEDEVSWIWGSFGEDQTLETLDSVSASLDLLPFSLDSPNWVGGEISISAFSNTDSSGSFDGTALTANLITAESRITPSRTLVERVIPVVDGAGEVLVSCGYRDNQNDTVIWTNEIGPERDGTHVFRLDNRYHRFQVGVIDGFSHASGLAVLDPVNSSRY